MQKVLAFFFGPFQLGVTELHNHPRVPSSVEFFLYIRTEDLLYQIIESCGANGDEDGSGGGIHPHSAMAKIALAIINFRSHLPQTVLKLEVMGHGVMHLASLMCFFCVDV